MKCLRGESASASRNSNHSVQPVLFCHFLTNLEHTHSLNDKIWHVLFHRQTHTRLLYRLEYQNYNKKKNSELSYPSTYLISRPKNSSIRYCTKDLYTIYPLGHGRMLAGGSWYQCWYSFVTRTFCLWRKAIEGFKAYILIVVYNGGGLFT